MKAQSKAKRMPTGVPFPKGKSGNPGGRAKVDPEVREALQAGNLQQLERLWRLSGLADKRGASASDKRLALQAVLAWLLKTVPNAERVELTGGGGGPIKVEGAREKLAQRLTDRILNAKSVPALPELSKP